MTRISVYIWPKYFFPRGVIGAWSFWKAFWLKPLLPVDVHTQTVFILVDHNLTVKHQSHEYYTLHCCTTVLCNVMYCHNIHCRLQFVFTTCAQLLNRRDEEREGEIDGKRKRAGPLSVGMHTRSIPFASFLSLSLSLSFSLCVYVNWYIILQINCHVGKLKFVFFFTRRRYF